MSELTLDKLIALKKSLDEYKYPVVSMTETQAKYFNIISGNKELYKAGDKFYAGIDDIKFQSLECILKHQDKDE